MALVHLHPTPYTLQLVPYTPYPTPCTLHPTPYTLHPTPYTLHPAPYTLHPTPYTLHPAPHYNRSRPDYDLRRPSTRTSECLKSPKSCIWTWLQVQVFKAAEIFPPHSVAKPQYPVGSSLDLADCLVSECDFHLLKNQAPPPKTRPPGTNLYCQPYKCYI